MLWPHQTRGIEEVLAAIQGGYRRVCLTSPTGMGKTVMAQQLAENFLERGLNVVLYTNRRMLVEQTSRVLQAAGLDHGVRASGYDDERHRALQVSSIQTEASRVLRKGTWGLHDAALVLVDEAHQQCGADARRICDAHVQEGGCYVGLTATPLDLGDLYDCLVVAGTTSEGRACGALVPCRHYGCDEPDLSKIGRVKLGEDLTEKENVAAIMREGVFGRVLEWYDRLNPERLPSILFAPGVAESLWFAEQFHAAGISAAHIAGSDVWVNGEWHKSSPGVRQQVMDGSRDGTIKIVCNRFVLREGIDMPWLAHGIFACVFGSLQSYLQAGGRLLRAHHTLDHVVIQDHGGNWHRHGSLNADREWRLGDTAAIVSGLREERLRTKACRRCRKPLRPGNPWCAGCGQCNEAEPTRCPQCGRILQSPRCQCGFDCSGTKKSRPVIQSDGTLREMTGDVFKPRRVTKKPDADKIWKSMYHRALKADMSFRQAEALFAMENNWCYPPRDLPLMPKDELHWFWKVKDVPRDCLT